MSEIKRDELFYIAPKEAPPSRRPPRGTVGVVGWLRKNLFHGPVNSVMTIATIVLLSLFLWEVFRWSIQDAQWNVVISNLRLLDVGQFPQEEIWRIELMGMILVFLSGLGVAIWGGTTRAFMLTIVVAVILMVLIPVAAQRIEPAPIRIMVGEDRNFGPMRFVGDDGQEITVAVEAINRTEYGDPDDSTFWGLFENAGGEQNTRIKWSEIRAAIAGETLDPTAYNLLIRVQLLNAQGAVVAEGISTSQDPNITLNVTLPADGWYILQAEVLTEASIYKNTDGLQLPTIPVRTLPNEGYAFIRLNNVDIYRTRPSDIEEREAQYGTLPAVDCWSRDVVGCQVAERAVRFEGSRTFGQFLKLQLGPFSEEITVPIVSAVLLFFFAYGLGHGAVTSRNPVFSKGIARLTTLGWLLLIPLTWFILTGIEGAEDIHPLLKLTKLSPEQWQGLTLTLILTFISVVASLPLGVLLALGRRSGLPVIGTFSVLFIELVRGAPLITILFFAKNIVPFFFSAGAAQDLGNVMRMLIGLTLFSAAYQAEIVRGGLQIIPKGQTEASQALGLNPYLTNTFIILPQALRAVIPATMSQFVSLFKDTSLVSIVGLFELLGMVELITTGQQQYRPFVREAYLYIGIIYFAIAFVMSAVSRRLEETGSGAARR
ncbi:MAG: amino acid ABC transporter permease [Anaerolineales bacterium]|nr:amino acid ABC transporter permease [Anaerolineales bacterium]